MTATWHARYCREAERLYDLVRIADDGYGGYDPVVLKLRDELAEHLRTCKECEREKPDV